MPTTQQPKAIGFTLKNILAATGLLHGLALTSPAAAVQCGDTIGPHETVVLQQDLNCIEGGLTIVGPATFDLNGHKFSMGIPGVSDPQPGPCITLEGERAVVRNGVVVICDIGVRVAGQGKHMVEQLGVGFTQRDNVIVESNRNILRQNLFVFAGFSAGGAGVVVQGERNKLSENRVEEVNGHGFAIRGGKNKLEKNTAVQNRGDGFGVVGDNNRLKKNKAIDNVDGYAIEDAANNTLVNNEALRNRDDGFDVQGGTQKTALLQNKAFHNGGSGLEVDGQQHRLIGNEAFDNNRGNYPDAFDLTDEIPNCDTNKWKHNAFGTAGQPCIK
jgi:parallel beta-helix repeat protein